MMSYSNSFTFRDIYGQRTQSWMPCQSRRCPLKWFWSKKISFFFQFFFFSGKKTPFIVDAVLGTGPSRNVGSKQILKFFKDLRTDCMWRSEDWKKKSRSLELSPDCHGMNFAHFWGSCKKRRKHSFGRWPEKCFNECWKSSATTLVTINNNKRNCTSLTCGPYISYMF